MDKEPLQACVLDLGSLNTTMKRTNNLKKKKTLSVDYTTKY